MKEEVAPKQRKITFRRAALFGVAMFAILRNLPRLETKSFSVREKSRKSVKELKSQRGIETSLTSQSREPTERTNNQLQVSNKATQEQKATASMKNKNDNIELRHQRGTDTNVTRPQSSFRNHTATGTIKHHQQQQVLCVLSKNNLFSHFPHAAEQLFPCWSFFVEHSKRKCAFLVDQDLTFAKGWVQDVVTSMNCTIYRRGDDSQPPPLTDRIVQYNTIDKKISWFRQPRHAQQLTQTILKQSSLAIHYNNDSQESLTSQNDQLTIGFVQRNVKPARGANRVFLNLDQVINVTQQHFPRALLEKADMMSLSTVQQVMFWNRCDVIFAAHGAACTNVAFMKPTASVIEIFPPNYTPAMFRHLAQKVGVGYYSYTASSSKKETVYPHKQVLHQRSRLRNVDLKPNISAMLQLIQKAVDRIQIP